MFCLSRLVIVVLGLSHVFNSPVLTKQQINEIKKEANKGRKKLWSNGETAAMAIGIPVAAVLIDNYIENEVKDSKLRAKLDELTPSPAPPAPQQQAQPSQANFQQVAQAQYGPRFNQVSVRGQQPGVPVNTNF